jgi:DNA adenine methylase
VKRGLSLRIEALNDEQTFYRHRAHFNQLIKNGRSNTAKAAQLFYYLNRTCFNGLWRTNRQHEFNVPFGTYRTVTYLTDFTRYKQQFNRWSFANKDFEELAIRKEDFIYADPPYDVGFKSYSANGFNWHDQVRAAKFFAEHEGPAVLSNQATPRIVELYETLGFNLRFLQPPQRTSITGVRQITHEVIATKNL